jgi:membrane protein YdbS with pleckstrin-like domain
MNAQSDPGHGHSPAAWTAVTIILIAFAAGTLAFWFNQPSLVWASAALVLIGLIVGAIMARAGYGARGPRYSPKAHS